MRLVCELFRKVQNSTKIHGICFAPANRTTRVYPPSSLLILAQLNQHFPASNTSSTTSAKEADSFGAGLFIVVVICFYSLSIVALVIFNIRFKIVFSRSYGICFCRESKQDKNYESQKEATKNTIHMIFNDSSKLFPALALTNSYLISAALGENLNSIQKEDLSSSLISIVKKDETIKDKELNDNTLNESAQSQSSSRT